MKTIKFIIVFPLFIINSIILCSGVGIGGLFKLFFGFGSLKHFFSGICIWLAETWSLINNFLLYHLLGYRWEIDIPSGLDLNKSYIVLSNHVSWVDIFVLQFVFVKKVPFFRYFLKDELKWVPFFGLAWWALDYPFMKRHKKEEIEKNPNLKEVDRKRALEACDKLKGVPTSILIFAEGTRWTFEKWESQNKAYKNLLKPRIGGTAFIFEGLGEQMDYILDVTIVYPGKPANFLKLFTGEIDKVKLLARQLELPNLDSNKNEPIKRELLIRWVDEIWTFKDNLIDQTRKSWSN